MTTTIYDTNKAIRKLQRSISEIHKESTKRQHQYILDLANISEVKGNDKTAKILREIAKQEQHNDAYARLGYARGITIKQKKHWSNPGSIVLAHIWQLLFSDVPLDLQDPKTVTNPDNWREIKCPAEIELMLIWQNQKHFGQAEGTLFTTEPLQSHFNWSASTHQAELVLQGHYSNHDIDHMFQT